MCLVPLRFNVNMRAAKILEVCERQEESSKIRECWEGKVREVEGLNVCANVLAACDGALVQSRSSVFGNKELQFGEIGEDSEEG